MKIGIRIKRLLAPILCITIISALFIVPVFAEETSATSPETEILFQLGVLDTLDTAKTVTKETAMKGLKKILGNSTPEWVYFENQNLDEPLLYGQGVMVLIDALGYSHYVEILGFDPSNAESYINTAKRIRLVGNTSKSAKSEMTVGEWSELLYKALVDIELMKPMLYGESVAYNIVKDSSMLGEYMKLTKVEAVVNGVDNVSIASNDGNGSNRIKIGGTWYKHLFTTDMYKYFGCSVEAFLDLNSGELKAIGYLEGTNHIIKVLADDVAGSTSVTRFNYYDANDRKKEIRISGDADFIYNRELVTTYTVDDLNVVDCNYTLIDNDDDGQYDVILADKYTSFVADSRQTENQSIVSTDGVVYDLKEYFKNGEKMYDDKGNVYGINLMHQYCTVSYLMSKSGKITNIVVMDDKYQGKITSTRDNMEYVSIDNVEFKTAAQYRDNYANHYQVKIGDFVMGLVDANGKIMEIRYIESVTKPAYFLAATQGILDTVNIKVLDSDGKIKTIELTDSVLLDGVKTDVDDLLTNAALSNNGDFKQQLVTYKQTASGKITEIDTAYNRNVLGECGYDEFTLNFTGTLRCMVVSGTKVFGTKYVIDEDTKVFNIVKDSRGKIVEKDCGVKSSSMFDNGFEYTFSLYNVNDSFSPEYVVYESVKNEGTWVDVKSSNIYMVEEITECLDNDGDEAYMLAAWGANGNMSYWFFHDEDLTSAGGTTWSYSWSPDSEVWRYKIKDLPKGSIISLKTGSEGIEAFVAHYIPGVSRTYFEKVGSTSGNYQGLDTNKFNASCLLSYGEVQRRIDIGFVVNNHIPTAKEEANGGVYPMEEWNRTIISNSTMKVIVYDSERKEIYVDNGNCVVPGDKVFLRRKTTTYDGIYVIK